MLIDNIHILRRKFPHIREYFIRHEADLSLDNYEVILSREGSETIRFTMKDGKKLFIHSSYDPIHEAERIINSHIDKIKDKTHIFFYGIGMGYHIEKFIELFPNLSFSLYEPIPEVFFRFSSHRNLNKIFSKNLKGLYIDQHDQENSAYLDEFNTSNKNIQIILLPSYNNIIPNKILNFNQKVKDVISIRRTKLRTDAFYQKLWVKNSLFNFDTVLNTPNILKDIKRVHFENKPAIIVSAGPSLTEDIEYLRYIKENSLAYIFSAGSAINSLIEYDVLPDAVFTYDPKERNKNVFKKMIEKNIVHIPMVFGSSVGYETIREYKGPKVHFITSQDRASLYFLKENLNLNNDIVIDSPSIAVMTFQILIKLGLNPIIFSGQNLGYLNNRRFAEGIEYEHIKSKLSQKELKNALTTKDVYGNEIKTNLTFNNMRKALEEIANFCQDRILINTTKGGAEIRGIPFKPIEEVIDQVLKTPIEKKKWWEVSNGYNKLTIGEDLEGLKSSIKEFTKIILKFEKLLDTIKNHTKIRNKSLVLEDLTQFDTLYHQLFENIYFQNFLSFYIRIHVNYLANEINRLNFESDILVRGKEIVPIFKRFLDICREEHAQFQELLLKTIGNKF